MPSLDPTSILLLYHEVVTASGLQQLQKQAGVKFRRGVYSLQVVLWLMILQRLHAGATLAYAVQLLLQNIATSPWSESCQRLRQRNVSSRTGAYCQARQKLPKVVCEQVGQQIIERLQQMLGRNPTAPPMFVLDGSSLELEHCRELVDRYPPATNQYGKSHWPVLRIVVAHDLDTALAYPPEWGAMYGPDAVSEQQLAEQMMSRLPAESTVIADRNFGVLWMAYSAQQRGLGVLLRLTEPRARKLAGSFSEPGEREVVWKSSRADGGKQRRIPEGATVCGRVIAARIGRGKSKSWLYLFTTLSVPWQQAVTWYGQRINIETDLRSLKRTVNLHHIHSKTCDMLAKELLIAMSAYNLVRTVMTLAARRHGLSPRQLSFSGVLNVVRAVGNAWMGASTAEPQTEQFLRVLDSAAQCTLPKRSKSRSYPRKVWNHCQAFPARRPEKTK
jgi:DDE family transposase